MRRRFLTISAIRFGEMPIAFASWFCERRYSAKNSSFSISPGVTGANSLSAIFRPASVIVDDLDRLRLAIDPLKDHTPLIIDANRVVVLQIALELFKAI